MLFRSPERERVTDVEVERARTTLLNDMEKAPLDSLAYVRWLGEFASVSDWRLFFVYREHVRKTTTADVQRALDTYLKPANRVLGVFVPTDKPDRADVPAAPDIAAALAEFRSSETVQAGEVFDPTPANIEARVIRHTLANGIKIALLPKKTRGETVQYQLRLHTGDATSLKDMSQIGRAHV